MKTPIKLSLFFFLFFAGRLFSLPDGGVQVYITNSGEKYHADGCTSLRRSKIPITLKEALERGYQPCGICQPPVLSAAPAPVQTAGPLYRVDRAALKRSADADKSQMLEAQVVGHVDGDTVRIRIAKAPPGLETTETIRMLGVDTPETVHPRRPVQRFGKEASDFTKSRLLHKKVYLAFDWDLRDRYGRLLAYIYTESAGELVCHNAALLREGYGHAYTVFAFHFAEEFRALEQEARRERRGLWGDGA